MHGVAHLWFIGNGLRLSDVRRAEPLPGRLRSRLVNSVAHKLVSRRYMRHSCSD